ncbi:Aste57867_2463 [Aphanomyces stellatus]|uniref:Aste57867_2463 protein n=1 Tax=Aphanomyces stellatus TaxID=120398 RepID=A0A485K7L4_9STRA|nr:hypothetical protein As57867_002457 [Aphanomyces stellatus]VFT79663.1 Aste57867_2463 [Aphanomyces stellatus]
MDTSLLCCFRQCSRAARIGKPQCIRHKKKRLCSFPLCGNMANKASRCVRHGARHGRCRVSTCRNTRLRVGGFCSAHTQIQVQATRCAEVVAATKAVDVKKEKAAEDDDFPTSLLPSSGAVDGTTIGFSVYELDIMRILLFESDDKGDVFRSGTC